MTLNDGQFHSVDGNELSFKLATAGAEGGAAAVRAGAAGADPERDHLRARRLHVKVLQLISGKRGQILGYEAKESWRGWDEIKAQILQGEMHDLIVTLRSLSQGTGFFEWSYDHLQEVPDRLAHAIVEKHRDLAS